MMRIEKQLSVFLENRPGGMAKVCGTLADAGVNMLAISIHDTVDHAIIRLVVDQHVKALLLLEQQGLYILEQDVVLLHITNQPGALGAVARKLAHADINIEYAYCTATEHAEEGCLILKTDQPERTLELLRDEPD